MLLDPVATHARARASATAVVDLETQRSWTYAELDLAVDRLAAWLVDQFGPRSGQRVAALSKNCAEMLLLHLACVRAGAIFVPLSWRLAGPEILSLLKDCQPAVVFNEPEFTVPGPYPRRDIDGVTALGEAGRRPHPAARAGFNEPATLLYTSGTSGRPKGVIVTEANAFWGNFNFVHGNDVTIRSVFLCDMPMFHTAGLFAATRPPLLAGGRVLISRGFEPETTLGRIADPDLGVTHYFSVPQMAQRLWNQPGFEPSMLWGLTVYAMGGAPNPAAQIERFVKAGINMSDGFGMSETGSNFGMPVSEPELLVRKAGSCGRPYMSTQARVVAADGSDAPDGEPGELWLRGPSVTPGYWNQPELTAKAFSDGWFMTGDVAVRDKDGFYFLIDRKKDMFVSGGENVYPAEVEAALVEMDGVAEAAVIGVPDARWGEVGHAYVIAAPGVELTETQILAHCRQRLAGFKTPAKVVLNGHIPRTATGKVQKHLLKSNALDDNARPKAPAENSVGG